jgi:putative transposase
MRKERKHYTSEEKVSILRRHLLDKIPVSDLCEELGLQPTVFYRWQKEFFRERSLRPNEHNGWIPRDFWLEPWEKQAIIGFHRNHPLEGYRRLTFMMLDADVVAVSPSSVWRVLQRAGLLSRWRPKPSHRRFLHQREWYLLLPLQRSGRL